jgi:hypothetical protein
MPFVTERRQSVQYDGTNGPHICGEWSNSGLSLVSDDGQTLVLEATEQPEYQTTAHAGDWIIATPPYWVTANTPGQYARNWLELP